MTQHFQRNKLVQFKSFQDLSGYLNKKNQNLCHQSTRYSSVNKHKALNPQMSMFPILKNSKISTDLNLKSSELNLKASELNQISSDLNLKSYRNSSFKLQQVSKTLNQIQLELKSLISQTKETKKYKQSLKKYLYQDMSQNTLQAKQQIKKLSKLIRTTRHINNLRVSQIYEDCGKLWQQNEEIKQKLFQIKTKTQKIEELMGADNFYTY